MAEVVIESISRGREDRRQWKMKARTSGGVRHESFVSQSFDHMIGMVEVLAQAIDLLQPSTLAFPAFGQIGRLLSGSVRLRQPDLHRATAAMSAMQFKTVSPHWLLATNRRTAETGQPVVQAA